MKKLNELNFEPVKANQMNVISGGSAIVMAIGYTVGLLGDAE